MKKQLADDTIGSRYLAWQPNLGQFDIRWAAELPPFGKSGSIVKTYDKDLDLDLDKKLYGAVYE